MTNFNNLHLAAMDVILAYAGVSVTYTEAGGSGQTVTALEESVGVEDHTFTLEFKFETTDLTISNWRGATITASDSNVYRVIEMEDSPGVTKFTGVRDVERS